MVPSLPGGKKSKPQASLGNFPGPGGIFPSEKKYISHGSIPSMADREKVGKPGPGAKKTAVQAPPATPEVKAATNRARAVARSAATQTTTGASGGKKKRRAALGDSAVASLLGS